MLSSCLSYSRYGVFLLVLSSLPLAEVSGQSGHSYRVRASVSDCVNVRASPSASANSVACIPAGTQVTVLESVPYWRRLPSVGSQQRWMAKKFLEPITPPVPLTGTAIPADAWLEVHFVDVGQGDGIWIHTHDDGIDGNGRFEGRNIVIDGGPYSSDRTNPFLPYLEDRAHHGAVIDALIVTHAHTDHYRGAETLSRHFTIQDYYDPGFPSTASGYQAFLTSLRGTDTHPARAQNIHLGQANFGILDWGGELTAEVLYAWPGNNTGLGSGNTLLNNTSIVMRLEYGNHSFLFMGDGEGKDRNDSPATAQYVEQILLNTVGAAQLDVTVLKVGHHGSETSSTLPFIQAVDPEIVVVQSGRKSFNGTFIPDTTTLQRYCNHNAAIRIYRTDQNDAADGLSAAESPDGDHIVIRTNGTTFQVEAFEGGQPFTVNSCQLS